MCIWTAGIDDAIHCPIAHGEGRYVHPDPARSQPPARSRCATPVGNPNGSVDDIAGVCDATGVVLGSDAASREPRHRPPAPRIRARGGDAAHLGLRLFEQRRRYAKER